MSPAPDAGIEDRTLRSAAGCMMSPVEILRGVIPLTLLLLSHPAAASPPPGAALWSAGAVSPSPAALCPRISDLSPIDAPVVARIEARRGYGAYDHRPRALARAINARAAHLLAHPDSAGDAALLDVLLDHARAGAWAVDDGAPWGAPWAVTEALTPLALGWLSLRPRVEDDATASEIDDWLRRLHASSRANGNRNNQAAARGANAAILGVAFDDDALLVEAFHEFARQMEALRPDGRFPLEAARGRLALAYASRNIASLVMIAEAARARGVDLYAPEPGRAGLRDAIAWLLRADADPHLADAAARADRHTPETLPFRPGAQANPFRGGLGGWVRLFAAARPHDALALRLIERTGTMRGRIVHDALGGWLSCFAGRA